MKKISHYSVILFLTVILSGGVDAFAHVPERKTKSNKVVLARPAAQAIVIAGSDMTRTGYIRIDRQYVWSNRKRNHIVVGGQHLKKRSRERQINGHWERINKDRIFRPGCWNRVLQF